MTCRQAGSSYLHAKLSEKLAQWFKITVKKEKLVPCYWTPVNPPRFSTCSGVLGGGGILLRLLLSSLRKFISFENLLRLFLFHPVLLVLLSLHQLLLDSVTFTIREK